MHLSINFLFYSSAILFSVVSVHTVYGLFKVNRNELFSKALVDIIRNYHVKNNLTIDFVIAEKACIKFANEIITNILRHSAHIIGPVTVNTIEESKTEVINLTRSSVIFVARSSISERLLDKVTMENTDYMRFHHYVVIQRPSEFHFNTKLISETDSVHYTSFLLQNDNTNLILNAITYMDDNKCALNLRNVNEFSIKNGTWKSEMFYEKANVKNYNFCKIIIAIEFWKNGKPYKELVEFLFEVLGKKFDFIPSFELYASGDIEAFNKISPIFDYFVKDYKTLFLIYNDLQYYVLSQNEVALLVSIGEPYEMFEKLMLPFDFVTWMLILFCFLVAFYVIFQMRWLDRSKQSFLFGLHVTTPAMNILGAFFGQSQTILPGRNFGRYMLMVFILFCLIVRTAYQSLQFDLMLTVSRIISDLTSSFTSVYMYVYVTQKIVQNKIVLNDLNENILSSILLLFTSSII